MSANDRRGKNFQTASAGHLIGIARGGLDAISAFDYFRRGYLAASLPDSIRTDSPSSASFLLASVRPKGAAGESKNIARFSFRNFT